MSEKPKFFATPAAFRAWLAKHHDRSDAQWVGFYKRGTGKKSITWPESVDEALSFGWIDGVRRSIDDTCYTIRFTPRLARSIWSAKNIARFHELAGEGRIEPAGQRAFDERDVARTNQYSFEQERVSFDREQMRAFRSNKE